MNQFNPDAPKQPILMELEPDKNYAWCTCGYTSNGPFCDGSHKTKTEGMAPKIFQVEQRKTYALCACKRTNNPAFCDGTHSKI